MEKIKKVSFRVRRIYYDQFAAGTKHEELRALKPYWVRILQPFLPYSIFRRVNIQTILEEHGIFRLWSTNNQPLIAVISTPGQPTLYFEISTIYVDKQERILKRELSEDGKKDIPTEYCIVTKMGEQIE